MGAHQGIESLHQIVTDKLTYLTNDKRVEYNMIRAILLVGEALLEIKNELQDIKKLMEENK